MNLTGRARSCVIVVGVGLVCLGHLNQVNAAGYAIIEHSASSMGNAFAGVAATGEDASTVFFNPAGMSLIADEQLVGALHYISPNASFSNRNSSTAAAVGGAALTGGNGDGGADAIVPNLYYVKPLSPDITFGLGINVPFGLAVKYDDDWVGRYHAVESELKTVNINPSVSWKFGQKLSVGYGINMQTARVRLTSAIDFGSICYAAFSPAVCASKSRDASDRIGPQNNDGYVLIQARDSLSFGWNAGLMYQLSDSTRMGVAYRSPVSHYAKGTADFTVPGEVAFLTNGGAFLDTGITAKLRTPDMLSISMLHKMKSTTLLADITWTGWSNFEELRVNYDNPNQPDSVTTEEWEDAWRYSVGLNYKYSSTLLLRSGLAYDETPVPSAARRTPRLPGNNRTWLSFGANYQYSKKLSLDFGYAHLFIEDAEIANEVESESAVAPAIAANLTGSYAASVDIFSVQFVWSL